MTDQPVTDQPEPDSSLVTVHVSPDQERVTSHVSPELFDESQALQRAHAAMNFGITHGANSGSRPAVKVSLPASRQTSADEAAILAAGQAAARGVDLS